jgi:hypothetical protein
MGKRRGINRVLVGKSVGNLWDRDHLEDPSVDERIVLIWFFRKWGVVAWTGLI